MFFSDQENFFVTKTLTESFFGLDPKFNLPKKSHYKKTLKGKKQPKWNGGLTRIELDIQVQTQSYKR